MEYIILNNLSVCWLSAGVSSFISAYLLRDSIDEFIYIDIDDQHPDTLRFLSDCESVLKRPITIIKSSQYTCVDDVCRSFRFINSAYGAKCTEILKKRVRKKWEYDHSSESISYVWGFDSSELNRSFRLSTSMPSFKHLFPLIDFNLTKSDCHLLCSELKIKRPIMYDLGYPNNNCIGCVKGGAGYWNKIRIDFPDVFYSRSVLERDIGHSILHNKNGMLFLDELDPCSGRKLKPICSDCGISCEIGMEDSL